ncbi:hypothetical protein FRAHR75_320045 [Frankia sp. Hr75.2]|nr:hypothetical protein FRAHR75_320045 [Frankia sp. Hr75.2]
MRRGEQVVGTIRRVTCALEPVRQLPVISRGRQAGEALDLPHGVLYMISITRQPPDDRASSVFQNILAKVFSPVLFPAALMVPHLLVLSNRCELLQTFSILRRETEDYVVCGHAKQA